MNGDFEQAVARVYDALSHINYLKCAHHCECGRQYRYFHPISDKSRRRLARDMARAALEEQ